jgi:hypothetical protein
VRAIIFAALVAATPALAQEPTSTIGLGLTRGTFDTPGDLDRYRVSLKQGHDYAFSAFTSEPGDGRFTLRGPTGTVLGSDVAGDGEAWGMEFRAGRDGYFVIEAKEDGDPGETPIGYSLRMVTDCRDDLKTKCTVAPGTARSHTLAWGEDRDWLRLVNLSSGRSYTATISGDTLNRPTLALYNGTGGLVTKDGISMTFKAGTATKFLAVISQTSFGGSSYKLELR